MQAIVELLPSTTAEFRVLLRALVLSCGVLSSGFSIFVTPRKKTTKPYCTGSVTSIYLWIALLCYHLLTMGKARVGARLAETVGGKQSHNKSQELARLTARYNDFVERLKGLTKALQAHHDAMVHITKTRYMVSTYRTLRFYFRKKTRKLGSASSLLT